jgi:hypothetical protein
MIAHETELKALMLATQRGDAAACPLCSPSVFLAFVPITSAE